MTIKLIFHYILNGKNNSENMIHLHSLYGVQMTIFFLNQALIYMSKI